MFRDLRDRTESRKGLLRQIAMKSPRIALIHATPVAIDPIVNAFKAGATGFVTKNSAPERLLQAIVRTDQGLVLAMDPADAQRLATKIARVVESAVAQPVLLCTPTLRPHFWRLFARVLPHVAVLSHNEVPPHVRVTVLSVLD